MKKINLSKRAVLKISTIVLYRKIFEEQRKSSLKCRIEELPLVEFDRKTVGRIGSLKIEVRCSEKHHNVAHFHVSAPGKVDAVYTINPLACCKGDVDSKLEKKILKWAELNMDILKKTWNEYHGIRITVD